MDEYHYVVQANSEKEADDLISKGIFSITEKQQLRKEWI